MAATGSRVPRCAGGGSTHEGWDPSSDAKRAVRRVTNAWRASVVGQAPDWMRRSLGPPVKYLDMLFVDHGTSAWSTSTSTTFPACGGPRSRRRTIRRLAREGIRTVVNLRGEACGSFWLEEQACARHGIALVNFLCARGRRPWQELRGARALRAHRVSDDDALQVGRRPRRADERALPPFQGRHPDRAGEARAVVALRPHRQADTGILDYFFERYPRMPPHARSSSASGSRRSTTPRNCTEPSTRAWANRLVDGVLRQ